MKPDRVQRFSNTAAPGSLVKRMIALATKFKIKESSERDPTYLARMRELPCLKCGLDPCGEVHHVKMQSGAFNKRSAMGKRAADRHALPLCGHCHRLDFDSVHNIGERTFFARLKTNPLLVCERLYAARGDILAMRATIFVTMLERVESEVFPHKEMEK